ncbi:MAG: DNA polymerase I [Gammaproteobacteria bacterium AqS3]|nr:DNA polymerase I [Gammaproteobacteria bacterium AqS3]
MSETVRNYTGWKSPPSLVLVDGSAFMFRAYHALPMLTTKSGHPTNAIRGIFNMLDKLRREFSGVPIAVVFDPPGGNFRNDIFPPYKAHRGEMDDELRTQIRPIHDFVRALGMPLIVEPGCEADDVIGTLARRCADDGGRVVICSNDKDLCQLIDENVVLYDEKNGFTDSAAVEARRGLPPARIAELLALWGDASDNIPGVQGVGEKTAVKWLKEYGDLNGVIRSAEKITGKVGENLRAGLGDLELYLRLTTVQLDIPVDFDLSNLSAPQPDVDALRELCQNFEFRERSNDEPARAGSREAATDASAGDGYDIITGVGQLKDWCKRLKAAEWFAFDTETTDLNYMRAHLVGLSFATPDGSAAYVPLHHAFSSRQLETDLVLRHLKPLLCAKPAKVVGHNIKYDAHILHLHHGIDIQVRSDTMLESYVLNSTATRHNMTALAQHYLDYSMITYEEVAGKGSKQITFDQVAVDDAARYAAEDASITARLHSRLSGELSDSDDLSGVLADLELPFLPVLGRIERNGVMIDSELLRQQTAELSERLDALQQSIWKFAGREFNIGSPKQLGKVLFEEMELKAGGPRSKTSTGQASTAERVLKQLEGEPIVDALLEHRSLDKLRSTYTDVLPKMVDPGSGRVHTSYHQASTSTGRLSSSEPNLQNIPIRTEEGRRIRTAFIAPPGRVLLAADYSQIELRVMAHLADDARMIAAFKAGADIHATTAAEVFDCALDEVSPGQRRRAKAINFGLIYGITRFGLANQLDIDVDEAQSYMDLYFERYPGIHSYMEQCVSEARERGYVSTLAGRRIHLKNINSKQMMRRQGAERVAINAPVQGTAADIIKLATIQLDAWLRQGDTPDAQIVLQVHDELVLEVDAGDVEVLTEGVRRHMQEACELRVPLQVDIQTGANWEQAH